MSVYDKGKPKTSLQDFSILVVDDDAMVRAILVEYLEKFGFTNIVAARNGKKALFLINQPQDFDLVISDWEMPEADGLTLLKAVRKNPRMSEAKFILVTSQTSQERQKISQAKQWKVDAYLVKPFRGHQLKQKVYEVLNIDPMTDKVAS